MLPPRSVDKSPDCRTSIFMGGTIFIVPSAWTPDVMSRDTTLRFCKCTFPPGLVNHSAEDDPARRGRFRWPGRCLNPRRRNTGGVSRHRGQWCSRTERPRCRRPHPFVRFLWAEYPLVAALEGTSPGSQDRTAPDRAGKCSRLPSVGRRGRSPASPAAFRWAEAKPILFASHQPPAPGFQHQLVTAPVTAGRENRRSTCERWEN